MSLNHHGELVTTLQTPPSFLNQSWNLPALFSFCIWSSDKCFFYYFIKCFIKIFGEHLDLKGRQTAKWGRSSIISAAQTKTEDCALLSHQSHLSSLRLSPSALTASISFHLSVSLPFYLYIYIFFFIICLHHPLRLYYAAMGGKRRKKSMNKSYTTVSLSLSLWFTEFG